MMGSMFPYCKFCMKVLLGHLPEVSFSAANYGREITMQAAGPWLGRWICIPCTKMWHVHKILAESRDSLLATCMRFLKSKLSWDPEVSGQRL